MIATVNAQNQHCKILFPSRLTLSLGYAEVSLNMFWDLALKLSKAHSTGLGKNPQIRLK